MLKRFGGFIANVKLPPLLIPAIPCKVASNELCNGWFIPSMQGQKACLHCLNHKAENQFPVKTCREEIITDIIITWSNDTNWVIICEILETNQKEYERLTIYKDYYETKSN